ncbi:peptidylprolyl isomerase [candidate division KSB1 bacterium]|nr:peptidylprolyl isomerase [candidate division KSB1 bacterium]
MLRKIIALFYLLLFIAQTSVYPQQVIDKIVAIVDDDIILQSELLQYSLNLAFQMKVDPRVDQQKFTELQSNVLNNMINQKIFLTKAEEDTIEVNEREVDNMLESQIERMVSQLGSEEKLEEYMGAPISKIKRDFRDDVRDNLKVESLKAQFIRGIQISRREVNEFYSTMKDSLPNFKETVDISHILITEKPSIEAEKRALAKATEIRQRLESGEDFAEMAKQFSEDPGSKDRGGELGFFNRGEFIKEFEEAAFNLKPDQLSDVVQTEHGYHIIKLIERQGERINVRHILIRLTSTKEDAEESQRYVDNIVAMMDDPEVTFADLAKQYSDDETTKDQGGHLGLFAVEELQEPEFIKAINQLDVGEVSKPFKTRFGWHILKLNSREEAREISIEKDWEQIEKWALNVKQQQELEKWLEKLKTQTFVDIKQ